MGPDDCGDKFFEDELVCRVEISPGSTKYWCPVLDDGSKPVEGQMFETLGAGVDFYHEYAAKVGFDIRHSTVKKDRDGEVVLKYLVCCRQGFKLVSDRTSKILEVDGDDSGSVTEKRRRISNRVGCKARIVFKKVVPGGYRVFSFEDRHNHSLCSLMYRQFLKVNRKLDFGHQTFVANCAKANIGTSQCFRLCKEFMGGYEYVGGTNVDFQNLRRDLRSYIDGRDAQLAIDQLTAKKEQCAAFFYKYDMDENDQLRRVFWADPVAIRNCSVFGDIVSFDATYSTNRYKLVFVPFTGVDNHKRCVTLGAGLLTKEDIPSYVWLLESFKEAMGRVPSCFVSDQDPAMKVALARVYPESRHRYCMWHIMSKVSEKVGPSLSKDEVFRRKLNAIVWDEIQDVDEFEGRWRGLVEEYGLVDHAWFTQLWEARSFWIPAYFKDLFMCGLVRTTSRSEGENSFFGRFFAHTSSLVEFFSHFNSAIEAQRHAQLKLNAECEGHYTDLKTPLPIERHASVVYTVTIFHEVQSEIYAGCFSCRVVSLRTSGDVIFYEIKGDGDNQYNVQFNQLDHSATCSCSLYQRIGLLCRHIFMVYKDARVENIPSCFIVARWTRGVCLQPVFEVNGQIVDLTAGVDSTKSLVKQMWSEIYSCVGLAGFDTDRVLQLTQVLQQQKDAFIGDGNTPIGLRGNNPVIQSFCGSTPSAVVSIKPPVVAKNKGSGRRLKGGKEKSMHANSKGGRKCHGCDKRGGHDSRNCPVLKAAEKNKL